MTDDHVGYPTAHSAWNGWSSSLPTREGLVGGVRISAQFLRDYELPQSQAAGSSRSPVSETSDSPHQGHVCMIGWTKARVGCCPGIRDFGFVLFRSAQTSSCRKLGLSEGERHKLHCLDPCEDLCGGRIGQVG